MSDLLPCYPTGTKVKWRYKIKVPSIPRATFFAHNNITVNVSDVMAIHVLSFQGDIVSPMPQHLKKLDDDLITK